MTAVSGGITFLACPSISPDIGNTISQERLEENYDHAENTSWPKVKNLLLVVTQFYRNV